MACQNLGFGKKLLTMVWRMTSKGSETGGKEPSQS